MERNDALRLWDSIYGNKDVAYDYAAQIMKREDFDNPDSNQGWTIDFIKPLSNGGTNIVSNLMICNTVTKNIRGSKASFRIGNDFFEVRKGKKYGTFALFDVTDRNHPMDMTPNSTNQTEEFNSDRRFSMYGSNQGNGSFVLPAVDKIQQNVLDENFNEQVMLDDDDEEIDPEFSVDEEYSEPVEESEESEEETFDDVEKTAEETSAEEPEETSTLEQIEETTGETTDADEQEVEETEVEETIAVDEPEVVPTESLVEENEQVVQQQEENLVTVSNDDVEEQQEEASIAENEVEEPVEENADEPAETLEETPLENTVIEESVSDETDDELNEDVTILEDELTEKTQKVQQLEDEIVALNKELSAVIGSLEEETKLHAELKGIKSENNKSNEIDKQTLRTQSGCIGGLENAVLIFKKELEEKTEEIASLNEKLNSLNSEKEELNNELETLRTTGNENAEYLASKDEKINEYFLAIKEYETKVADKESELVRLQSEYDEFKEAKEGELRESSELTERLQKENEELRLSVTEVSSSSDETFNRLQRTLENVRRDNDSLNNQLEFSQQRERKLIIENNELDNTNKNLTFENNANQEKIESLNFEINNKDVQIKDLEDKISETLNELAENKNRITEIEDEIQRLNEDKENLRLQAEHDKEEAEQRIDVLIDEVSSEKAKTRFASLGGNPDSYDEFLSVYNGDIEDDDKIASFLIKNSQFRLPVSQSVNMLDNESYFCIGCEDVELHDEVVARRKQAFEVWDSMFGSDVKKTHDFAGRPIVKEDFEDRTKNTAWSFEKVNEPDEKPFVVIANTKSLDSFNKNAPFTTNGKTYVLAKDSNGYHIDSNDSISDPFDFTSSIRVTKAVSGKVSPMVYIFIKCVPIEGKNIDDDTLHTFYELVDGTVRKFCPETFLEIKYGYGEGQKFVFLTFDASKNEAYDEALKFAVLLNSYRIEFKKMEKGMNMIIVLNQINVPPFVRHYDFPKLLNSTSNIELKALQHEFIINQTVNESIKRTLHIGPSIIPHLNIESSNLKDSLIGVGRDFRDIYNFRNSFKVYNAAYHLSTYDE